MKHRRSPSDPGASLVPVPKFERVDLNERGGVPIGRLLEMARRRIDMSEAAAAGRLRIDERELLAFESGMRTPPPSVLEQMTEMYGTSMDRMRSDAGVALDESENATILHLGWAPVELFGIDSRERLFRIAATFRELRSLAQDAPVTIRDDELAPLARTIDVDDENLIGDLEDALRLSNQQAVELSSRLRYKVANTKELPAASRELGPA